MGYFIFKDSVDDHRTTINDLNLLQIIKQGPHLRRRSTRIKVAGKHVRLLDLVKYPNLFVKNTQVALSENDRTRLVFT